MFFRGWAIFVGSRQWRNVRGVSTSSSSESALSTLLKQFGPGRVPPQVVPFQLTPQQAKQEFLSWQRRQRVHLAPSDLLSTGTYDLKAALLPFWLFSVRARVEYRGTVGQVDRGGGVDWREVGWKVLPPQEYPCTDPAMQVYASYRYRRDFAEVAKGGGRVAHMLQPLPQETAERGVGPPPAYAPNGGAHDAPTALDPPTMRQAIAWEFALRAIHEKEVRDAEARLRGEQDAQRVRDVHVRVTPLDRRVRLSYLPAYVLDYVYGETFNVHGERRAEEFQALVSGAVPGVVAGERHISAHKVSLAAGTLALGAMAATGVAAPLLGMDPWALVGVEGAFYAVVTAWTAGLGARLLPLLVAQHAEEARVRAEDAEFERVVNMGMGPLDPGTQEQEVLRSNAEWRRWEESDKGGWREHKRQRWAEELWRGQHRRRLERIRMAERLHRDAQRYKVAEERERRRQQRWGSSSQQHHFGHHGNVFAGGHKAGGRRDFLGYYRLLGLEAQAQHAVTQQDIKAAFRRAALQWHPDKHEGGHKDPSTKRHARHRFNEIRAAYEVLRDPERRRQYDSGQVVRP